MALARVDPLLPQQDRYLPTLPTPTQQFGHPIGERHLRYDQVLAYFQTLARQSPRVSLESAGVSHQGRQQIAAVITSEANQQRLDQILADRARVSERDRVGGPTVVWLAYSIHGDEASGLHAGTLFAYYLAASQSPQVQRWLQEMVILITPSQNPDGNDRFANWVNGYTGSQLNGSNWHREHFQAWPSGRVNHFLADLNRDWLYLRHPESRGRVAVYQRWQPHVVGDYHEMGHNSSYFFQPGVPSRTHPLTPAQNQSLTSALGRYHAEALDALGQPYFSRESFDDFYYGKGSTYPDINGGVGILFEQASVRGHLRDTEYGQRSFRDAIRNQLATSFSTVRGSFEQGKALQQYQHEFFVHSLEQGQDRNDAGLLVSSGGDRGRLQALAEILSAHQVEFQYLANSVTSKGGSYPKGSVYIPFAQSRYALVAALFDRRTQFADNTFYDVSAFGVDLAFNLEVVTLKRRPKVVSQLPQPAAEATGPALAWTLDWNQRQAPAALAYLLSRQIQVRFAELPGRLQGHDGEIEVHPGTLLMAGNQPGIASALSTLRTTYELSPQAVVRGQALNGPDLGSRKFRPATAARPLILVGRNVSQYEVGQLWSYLDQQVGVAATLIDAEYAERVPMEEFTHLFLVDGRYRQMTAAIEARIQRFVRQGGVLVAWQGGAREVADWNLVDVSIVGRRQLENEFEDHPIQFAERYQEDARRTIGGAIVDWRLDTSHPLGFGLTASLPMMKDREMVLQLDGGQAHQVARYAERPLLSGFMAPEYQSSVGGQASAVVARKDKGAVVLLADNPLFRNFWLGSERLVANSLYLVPALN
ncbi:M14 family zinc carboxypeptidase [Ferrimonas kyonanensis]|uniref:M14 family zinc carboxypeptidase n=1 Tax=Ferrimonas kyonanensis TaxID=364763 RepID=UPI000424E74E|nr:M14 family zinc carboxypeptidase [Ferrimonas kyonanensis]